MRFLHVPLAMLILSILAAIPARAAPAPFESSRFSVETVGSGPDVIMIPGLTASPEVWKGTIAADPGYRYHLVHIAGFAGAPVGGNARGPILAPLAEDLAGYIRASHLDRPAIVGHSMGGTLALMIAERHPELVGKIMVVDMLPQPAALFGSTAADLGGFADLLTALTGEDGSRRLVQSFMDYFSPDPASARRSDPGMVARAANELARVDLTPGLGRVTLPLTVVYASLDASTDRLADQRYRIGYAAVRGVRLQRIGPSSHMIMYDQPAALAAAVRRFLAG